MIELTPLEVRQKKNDFRRVLRGYDPDAVDDFLEIVASHLDVLVREKLRLAEEVEQASRQVAEFRERERALTEALVTAQKVREDVRVQAEKEADLIRREAEAEAERIREEARNAARAEEAAYRELRSRRLELLRTYRRFLERELHELGVLEETIGADERTPGREAEPESAMPRAVAEVPRAGFEAPLAVPVGPAAPAAADPIAGAGSGRGAGGLGAAPELQGAGIFGALAYDEEVVGPAEGAGDAGVAEVPADLDLSDALAAALGSVSDSPPGGPGGEEDVEFGGVGPDDIPAPRRPDWLESLLREEG